MFTVSSIYQNGFEKIVLKDNSTRTTATIIPSCGAVLHEFIVEHNGHKLNIIDNYLDKEDFKNNVTAKGFKSCKLSPFACRINNAQYQFGKKKYKIEKFILNGSALHGLLYDAEFAVMKIHADEEKAMVQLLFQYQANDKGYPFFYDCEITYTLEKENALTISTTIINKDKNLIPVQDGWHPYFSLNEKIDELELQFQSKEILEFDKALVPTGKIFPYRQFELFKKIGTKEFDNCFTVNFETNQPVCVLGSSHKKIQIEICPAKTYPYLQIYTPPHRNSIAIENLSAAPDAFNNGLGLISLPPGEKTNFTTTYKIRSLI